MRATQRSSTRASAAAPCPPGVQVEHEAVELVAQEVERRVLAREHVHLHLRQRVSGGAAAAPRCRSRRSRRTPRSWRVGARAPARPRRSRAGGGRAARPRGRARRPRCRRGSRADDRPAPAHRRRAGARSTAPRAKQVDDSRPRASGWASTRSRKRRKCAPVVARVRVLDRGQHRRAHRAARRRERAARAARARAGPASSGGGRAPRARGSARARRRWRPGPRARASRSVKPLEAQKSCAIQPCTPARPTRLMSVCRPVAQWVRAPPLSTYASTRHTVSVRPLRITSPTRDHALAVGGGEEVHLEFHGEHAGIGREEREARVAAGGVGDGGDDAGVEEAVLLGELGAERERDLDAARLHRLQHRAQVRHRPLAREARAGAALEIVVGRGERHFEPRARRPAASFRASRRRAGGSR